jgi:hypothetical protein
VNCPEFKLHLDNSRSPAQEFMLTLIIIRMLIMNEKLIVFISEFSGILKARINSQSRLFEDLRIYGDDSVELLIAHGKEFNVDVSNFMAADYFGPEGDQILPAIIRLITGKSAKIYKVLTVAHLEKGILAGKLDEDIINS